MADGDQNLSKNPELLAPDSGCRPISTLFEGEDEPAPLPFVSSPSLRSSQPDHDFEAVSARFRSILPTQGGARSAHTVTEDAKGLIRGTSDELRARSLTAGDADEQARLVGYADSLEKLLASPLALEYLEDPQVSRELATYLRRYRASLLAFPHDAELRDIVLKASVTAIHVAPCLGFWRASSNVPADVQKLLTAENVFGSVLRIAKERRGEWLDRLLNRYNAVTGELGRGDAPLPIKTRNPILWPWCRFNIKSVTYDFYHGDASLVASEEVIADIKVALVLFNVLLDDVADNLQDAELLATLLAIPVAGGKFGVASPEAYAKLRARLSGLGWSRLEAYFDLAVQTWTVTLGKLVEVVGAAYAFLETELAHDYDLILKAMRFSVELNNRPIEIFRAPSAELQGEYGGPDFGAVLAHNANRGAFFTIDLMCLRAFDASRWDSFVTSGAAKVYRQNAIVFQDMHQIGNSVATGARETESDDITNELFKIANDRLNTTDDWPLPEHLAALPGFKRRDALLEVFVRKKAAKLELAATAAGSAEHKAARLEYVALGEDIEHMVALSGAEHYYFHHWLHRREEAVDLFYQCEDWIDPYRLVDANDLVLVLHLMYKGRI